MRLHYLMDCCVMELILGITNEIVLTLFDQKLSKAESFIGETSGGYVVALLTDVVSISEINADSPLLKSIIVNLNSERKNDVYSIFRNALSTRYKISANQTALKRILDIP